MRPESSLRPEEAVGMKTKFASGPPASATNCSSTPVPKLSRDVPPPPESISAPLRPIPSARGASGPSSSRHDRASRVLFRIMTLSDPAGSKVADFTLLSRGLLRAVGAFGELFEHLLVEGGDVV